MSGKFYISYIIFALIAIHCQAQTVTFQKAFGGSTNDGGGSAKELKDGGYIIAGETLSFSTSSDADIYLIRTDSNGDTLWTRTYGGSRNEGGASVIETTDNAFVIGGTADDKYGAGGYGAFLMKVGPTGLLLWNKTFGGSDNEYGRCIQQTVDGGFIIAGETNSFSGVGTTDIYLIKTNSDGDTTWTKTYGGTATEYGNFVHQTSDGGYVITGSTSSYGTGTQDIYVVKTDTAGNVQWSKTFGGTYVDQGYCGFQTNDGGYMVAGRTMSFGADEPYLIKLNSDGSMLWSKTYNGSGNSSIYYAQQTNDWGYAITGGIYLNNWNTFLYKTDLNGNLQWSKYFGGSLDSEPYSIEQVSDGGYILTGVVTGSNNLYDLYLIKTDSLGSSRCNEAVLTITQNIPPTIATLVTTIAKTTTTQTFSTPILSYSPSTNEDIFCSTASINENISNGFDAAVYPNPSEGNFTISTVDSQIKSIVIYNTLGEIIYRENLAFKTYAINYNINTFTDGMYFIQINIGKQSVVKKILLQKK